jgi:hypothetical protein
MDFSLPSFYLFSFYHVASSPGSMDVAQWIRAFFAWGGAENMAQELCGVAADARRGRRIICKKILQNA